MCSSHCLRLDLVETEMTFFGSIETEKSYKYLRLAFVERTFTSNVITIRNFGWIVSKTKKKTKYWARKVIKLEPESPLGQRRFIWLKIQFHNECSYILLVVDNDSISQLSSSLFDNGYKHRVKIYFPHVSKVNLRSNIDEWAVVEGVGVKIGIPSSLAHSRDALEAWEISATRQNKIPLNQRPEE